jgi:hypothetical protein
MAKEIRQGLLRWVAKELSKAKINELVALEMRDLGLGEGVEELN